jgi:hypothetical protein
MTLEDVKKFKVVPMGTEAHPGSMEPIALFNPDGSLLVSGAITTQFSGDGDAAPNDRTLVTWSRNDPEIPLLDLTDPTQPTVLVGGLYMLTVNFYTNQQVGKIGAAQINLDRNGLSPYAWSTWDLGQSRNGQALIVLSVMGFVPAGGALEVNVEHNGDSTATFGSDIYLTGIPMAGIVID